MPPRLISTLTRAVVAAARAASAAAATSLITLRLPIGRSCSARPSTCSATATTIAGTFAAATRAVAMASDRTAASVPVPFGSRYASVTAVKAVASSSARPSALPRR